MAKITYQLLLGASLVAGVAHADTKLDEAKAHLQSGTALYDENNFRGALVEFQRAYELAPSYKILFNIAQVEMELQDYAGALKAYTRYVKEGGPDLAPGRVAQVNADIERLKARVGFLVIQTANGAGVLVDDAPVGYAPLPEPVAVSGGQHRVTVNVTGKEPVTRVFDVAGRQTVIAALAVDATGTAVQPPPATPAPIDGPPRPMAIYVAWGVTGGLAIVAGVFGVIAHGDANDLAKLRSTYPVTSQQLDSQRSKTVRSAALTDAFAGAAVLSAGAALYFTFRRTADQANRPDDKAVQIQIAPTSIAIAGRF
jgi:tetratricopeptide (TPR) repeat protein